ncbi:translational GTPase TypA [Hippea sp. KM1]|uniref:translational GTPase TypA n=1 Tax=Hippea sp. KM1 TaxID=944481 RepID=UPI00046D3B83|nr:translational GTPase TypA [Hippea sp. KM1]
MRNEKIRNIAIIAHVDHGKTTLVDAMLKQSGLFRENQIIQERMLDNIDLEREHGITIRAKNCAVNYKGVKINIVDTPGHADFGGEVERALSMVDGAILLVDAAEGVLPQTRFVLTKALRLKLPIIVVLNKIDRRDARPGEVLDEIYDLFIDLDANDEQLEFSYLYCIAKQGIARFGLDEHSDDLKPLFDAIIKDVPPPEINENKPFQMLVADVSYSDYLGRLAIGKVLNRDLNRGDELVLFSKDGRKRPFKIARLEVYEGLGLKEVDSVVAGDIAIIAGNIEDITIGDVIGSPQIQRPVVGLRIDEPTVAMRFSANTSPFASKEGSIVQANKIKDRLFLEERRNVSLRVEQTENPDEVIVKGRGELQLIILIESLRKEGYELTVGRPEVILKRENGKVLEPIEHLFIDCNEEFMGVITSKLQLRKGRLINMTNKGSGRVRLEFLIPTRALIGYRDEFLTDTKGTGIMNSYLEGYEEFKGEIKRRFTGSLVSDREGVATAYALFNLQPRGRLFITPNEKVYEGMIIGEHNKENDLNVNPTKEKKLSNMRAAGKDDNIILAPITPMSLQRAINFIKEDELVEITPKSIRLRKKILSAQKRRMTEHNRI